MDEEELIHYAKKGDLESFNQLVLLHQTKVYNLCWRMLGDNAIADDITQDTFLSAYRKLGSFHEGNFRAWLMRIAANACRDYFRSAYVRRNTSLEAWEENPNFVLSANGESPEAFTLRRELGDVLRRGLNNLPFDQRFVLVMVDVQGLTYGEVAEVMKLPIGTVKSRLSRGRIAMREALQKHRELLPEAFRSL